MTLSSSGAMMSAPFWSRVNSSAVEFCHSRMGVLAAVIAALTISMPAASREAVLFRLDVPSAPSSDGGTSS